MEEENPNYAPIAKLTRDLKQAARTLSDTEARYLVDAYYQMQADRIRASAQVRAQNESEEPHEVLAWLASNTASLEGQIKRALDAYSDSKTVGLWAKSITGIGPVIAAGLLAHIDITKAPTVGHIWRFAGLDPTVVWGKKQKRPWNATFKTLCWKIGESFVFVSANKNDFYGKLYLERKALEIQRNEAGQFADQAKNILETRKFRDDTQAKGHYEAGRLPPAHIHARAKRWAVKLFLSHYHHVAYEAHFKEQPPKPYILTQEGGHAHMITVPNWPMPTKSTKSTKLSE